MIGIPFACVAFLFGSLPSALLLTRAVAGVDVREVASGNVGAANAARAGGFKVGAAVAVIDVLKGAIPVWAGLLIGLTHVELALVAVAAVLGHDFSIFLKGKGGKGVATTLGVALVLAPPAALLAIVVWAAVIAMWRYPSLASIASLVVLPAFMIALATPPPYVFAATLLLIARCSASTSENIIRLLQGKERKFSAPRPANGG